MSRFSCAFAVSLAAAISAARAEEPACRNDAQGEARFVVCEFDLRMDDVRLFLKDESGAPYGDFGPLAAALREKGETLVFAMNAGMYHEDRSPVGLYVENQKQLQKASTTDGPGNFHLKPNGVFWVRESDDGVASAFVTETAAFLKEADDVRDATQSGPMLVVDGALHPRFLPDATSRKRRNGVGVRTDGTVVFALSDTPTTFHAFATYFRDVLKAPDALYLDGTISRVFAPELGRNDQGLAMGPIVGVVARRSAN